MMEMKFMKISSFNVRAHVNSSNYGSIWELRENGQFLWHTKSQFDGIRNDFDRMTCMHFAAALSEIRFIIILLSSEIFTLFLL